MRSVNFSALFALAAVMASLAAISAQATCPAGLYPITYCAACRNDTYKDTIGNELCTDCPDGTSILYGGATSAEECIRNDCVDTLFEELGPGTPCWRYEAEGMCDSHPGFTGTFCKRTCNVCDYDPHADH